MALKKPSELLDTKDSLVSKSLEKFIEQPQLNSFSEVFESFKRNVDNIDSLAEKVEDIQLEIRTFLKKEELEQSMMAQLFILEKTIQEVQNKVKSINEKKLSDIRLSVVGLTENVDKFVEVEIPKYKKLLVDSEQRSYDRYESFERDIKESISEIDKFTTYKFQELKETLSGINEESISSILTGFEDLTNTVKHLKEREIPKYKKFIIETEEKSDAKIKEFEENFSSTVDSFQGDVNEKISNIQESFDEFINVEAPKYNKLLVDNKLKTEKEVKKIKKIIETKIKEFSKDIEQLRDNVFESNDVLSEVADKTKELDNRNELELNKFTNELTNEFENYQKNLDKKLSDLSIELVRNESHIKVQNKSIESIKGDIEFAFSNLDMELIEKKNVQLSNKIKHLEEILEKFNEKTILNEFVEPPNTKNSDPLTPVDQKFVTFDQLQNHYRLFLNRVQQQLASLGGGGETQLKYLDDIVGIATNPSEYDNKFLAYDDAIKKFEFKNVPEPSLDLAEENIIYVAKDGDDTNDGTIGRPKLTIKNAVESIVSTGKSDQVVRVAPGTYIEDNPIILPDELTVIGHSLRENTVIPLNDDKDLFYVGNGNYIAEMSFRGSLPGKAIVAFDPEKPRYIVQSPYIQNCTNFIPDSIGLRIDGDATIGPLKSMVLDSYTQYNQGGIGCSITNQGYAQLVSLFTICNEIAVSCGSGGACDLTNSNSSFGNFGIVADGVSEKLFSGNIIKTEPELSDTFEILLNGPEVSVSNAVYDNITGLTTITTSSDHNFNVGSAVSISDLKFTCDSFTDIEQYTVSNAVYDEQSGILTVTTAEQNDLSVGISVTMSDLKFSCDSFVPVINYNVSNAIYDEQSGILTVTTSSDHNFTTNISVDFDGLVFECDSGGGSSTALFPPSAGDGNGDPDSTTFEVTSIPASNQFVVNVGPSTIAHTYQSGGTVAIGTITTFPSGRFGNVFEINQINSNTEFEVNVGVSTFIHSYVSGGDVSISTIANFPNGNQGYVFNVQKINSSTEFETYVGVSTFIHTYDSGGNVKLNLVRPYDGTVIFFNELYEAVDSIAVTDGGSGYTESPIVTISAPSEPWGIRAKAIANVTNGSVTSIDMISNGRGYTSDAVIEIADNSSGINTAIGVAVMQPEYYSVVSSTEISGGITTVTINENVPFSVGVGTTANFYKQSRILASGHSFEFVGAGNDISRATPFSGGFQPIPENETVSKNGGLVIFTSTNQSGNFKIGDGVTINQSTSSITGQAYEKSLVSTMTPYILSLGGF